MHVELSGHYGYRRLLHTALPMILMMIVVSVYSLVDGYFVSNFAGPSPFASMNIVWPIISLVAALGLMIGTGGSALVAKLFGEGKSEQANNVFTMLVWFGIIMGIVFAIGLCIAMPSLARFCGADEILLENAVLYGRIVALAMPCFILQMAFQPFYMVAEIPQFGTVLSIASGITNVALDAILMLWADMGLAGAAIGTAISLTVGGGVPLWYFSSKHNKTQLKLFPKFNVEVKALLKSMSNGLSEFVGNIALNLVSICYNIQLMKYIGEYGVSAYGIIMYLGFIFAAVFIGYNLFVSQVVSFNYGQRNYDELHSLLHKSLRIITGFGLFITILIEVSIPGIAGIIVGYNPDLYDITVHACRIYMLCFLISGINMFVSAWFTALNNGIVSAVAAFARTLVFELAAVFILPKFFGFEGIWYSVNLAEILALILATSLLLCFRKTWSKTCAQKC